MTELSPQQATAKKEWVEYFTDNQTLIDEAILNDECSVKVDYRALEAQNPEWAHSFFQHPRRYLWDAEKVINGFSNVAGVRTALKIEIHNLPEDTQLTPREVRSEHLNQFQSLRGVVKKATEIRPWLHEAVFECKLCANKEFITQEEDLLSEPPACGGCGKSGPWKFREEESTFVDACKIQLADSAADTPTGQQPEAVTCVLREHLVNGVRAGEFVVLHGVLGVSLRRMGNMKKTEFNKEFMVNSITHLEKTSQDIKLTKAQMEEFRAFAAENDPLDVIATNFARGIYGMDMEKKAILLSIVSGNRTERKGGAPWRGDIHLCLAGEPGTGKSVIMESIQEITPRCVYASGESASATGLSAAAVKDDFGDGGWSLEIGALGLANGGTFVLDEADKLRKDDMKILHKAMEQQEIEVHKASIHATVPTVCNVIMALNPKFGKFDDMEDSIVAQLNLPQAIYSRFDSIFIIRDNNTRQQEEDILDNIIKDYSPDVVLESRWMMEYLSYAKTFTPSIPKAIFDAIKDYYLDMKYANKAENINKRQFHSLRRLTEAHAKMNLRTECTMEDFTAATGLYDRYMKSLGVDGLTGTLDGGIINGYGGQKSQHDRMKTAVEVIQHLSKEKGYALEEDILGAMDLRGINNSDAEKCLQSMKRNNTIYNRGGSGTWALL